MTTRVALVGQLLVAAFAFRIHVHRGQHPGFDGGDHGSRGEVHCSGCPHPSVVELGLELERHADRWKFGDEDSRAVVELPFELQHVLFVHTAVAGLHRQLADVRFAPLAGHVHLQREWIAGRIHRVAGVLQLHRSRDVHVHQRLPLQQGHAQGVEEHQEEPADEHHGDEQECGGPQPLRIGQRGQAFLAAEFPGLAGHVGNQFRTHAAGLGPGAVELQGRNEAVVELRKGLLGPPGQLHGVRGLDAAEACDQQDNGQRSLNHQPCHAQPVRGLPGGVETVVRVTRDGQHQRSDEQHAGQQQRDGVAPLAELPGFQLFVQALHPQAPDPSWRAVPVRALVLCLQAEPAG